MRRTLSGLLLIVLLFGAGVCIAQSDYVVTLHGDTLAGKLRIFTYDKSLDRVQVISAKDKKDFSALEVRNVFLDGEALVTQKNETGYHFMKPIIEGYLSLYAFKPEQQTAFSGKQLVKLNGSSIELPNLKFRAVLANFLSDCEPVSEKLKSGELDRKDVEKIVVLYNDCIAVNNEMHVEEAKQKEINLESLELLSQLKARTAKLEFDGKRDAADLLSDISQKLNAGKSIPNYQREALREILAGQTELAPILEKFLANLK